MKNIVILKCIWCSMLSAAGMTGQFCAFPSWFGLDKIVCHSLQSFCWWKLTITECETFRESIFGEQCEMHTRHFGWRHTNLVQMQTQSHKNHSEGIINISWFNALIAYSIYERVETIKCIKCHTRPRAMENALKTFRWFARCLFRRCVSLRTKLNLHFSFQRKRFKLKFIHISHKWCEAFRIELIFSDL